MMTKTAYYMQMAQEAGRRSLAAKNSGQRF